MKIDVNDNERTLSDLPRAVVELRMCAMSNEIREKERWWEKMQDPDILAKWTKEVEEQELSVDLTQRLSPQMINYVFQELEGYAALRDPRTGIQPACFERVWRSDTLVSPELRGRLLAAVALLESTSTPDWHPGSDGKVLDLVHPSLYPLVYGKTCSWDVDKQDLRPLDPPRPMEESDGSHLSQEFCWLPSDFSIAEDGTARLASSYINNVDPSTQAGKMLVPAIVSLVGIAVPLWEPVLGELRSPLSPMRLQQLGTDENYWEAKRYAAIQCIWKDKEPPYPEPEEEEYVDRDDEWFGQQVDQMDLPEALEAYDGALQSIVKEKVNLKGSTIQVIVKLANIVLTPEKPNYGGGTWHVEGMENEHIVSTFIYYYDEHNVTPSTLSFRTATNAPTPHCQDDTYCMERVYGIERGQSRVQPRGSVTTCQHRSLAFPNIYQHCVSPFKLADPSRPGHRKIVALFLVDPTLRIPSATDVPPQQMYMYEDVLLRGVDSEFGKALPAELRDIVAEKLRVDAAKMSREEAEDVRERFMAERTKAANGFEGAGTPLFAMQFNMCEH